MTNHSPQQPGSVRAPDPDTHARALLLGAVHLGGVTELARILLHARAGDPVASAVTIGELVRALPDTGWLGAYDLLHYADVPEDTPVGRLTAAQRGALANILSRMDRDRPRGTEPA